MLLDLYAVLYESTGIKFFDQESRILFMGDSKITKFEKCFLYLLFFELFAGGGGRFFAVGPISIRQILFLFLFLIFGIRFIRDKAARNEVLAYFKHPQTVIFSLSVVMLVWVFFSGFLGILHHHPTGIVVTDVLRVIYIVMILPLIYYIDESRFSVKDLVRTLFLAVLVISLVTIAIGVAGKFMNDFDFYYFYKDINQVFPGDLFFRPSRGVFHKSHFLLLFTLIIASVKFMEKRITLFQSLVGIIAAVSIVFSETRGLYLGYVVGLITYILVKLVVYFWGNRESLHLNKKNNWRRAIFLVLACFLAVHFYTNSTISRFSDGGKPKDAPVSQNMKTEETVDDVSLNVRVVLLKDSIRILKSSKSALVIGSGYGQKIGDRDNTIEMSFVDILVEQGAIGVLLWLLFSLIPLYYYFRAFLIQKRLANIHVALLGCCLSMLVVTNINPFLNSPIGLGFLLPVIIISYKVYRQALQEKEAR